MAEFLEGLSGFSVVVGLIVSIPIAILLGFGGGCKVADTSNKRQRPVMESRCQFCHGTIRWHGGWGVGNWICDNCGRYHN